MRFRVNIFWFGCGPTGAMPIQLLATLLHRSVVASTGNDSRAPLPPSQLMCRTSQSIKSVALCIGQFRTRKVACIVMSCGFVRPLRVRSKLDLSSGPIVEKSWTYSGEKFPALLRFRIFSPFFMVIKFHATTVIVCEIGRWLLPSPHKRYFV
jgi:hypothetical protein